MAIWIPFVIDALEADPQVQEKSQGELENWERIDIILTIALLKSSEIFNRDTET